MPAKQLDGRIGLAELVAAKPIYIAWGAGDAAWDTVPQPEPVDGTGLVAEIGRRLATQVGYVLPAPAGEIETPQGNYTISAQPTRYLYIRTVFAFDDAPTAHIRELAVFYGSVPVGGLPDGQRYFVPAQIADPGRLLLLDRSQNFERNGAVRPSFEYVLPF